MLKRTKAGQVWVPEVKPPIYLDCHELKGNLKVEYNCHMKGNGQIFEKCVFV